MHDADNQEAKIVATVGRQLQSKRPDIRKTILAQLSCSHHRTIFSRCKTEEEREFYLNISIKENYSVREVDRQISAKLFERAVSGKVNIASLPEEC